MSVLEQESTIEAALARKHRIAMRNRQRSSSSSTSTSSSSSVAESVDVMTVKKSSKRPRNAFEEDDQVVVSSSVSKCVKAVIEDIQSTKKKPHITGIKNQSRYDPGVSMTKEELKTWRKEARRVRNRESAAASRKKNRESIQELETEVEDIKTKYAGALRYILEVEDNVQQRNTEAGLSSSPSFYPYPVSTALRHDLDEIRKTSSLVPFSLETDTVSFSRPCSPDSVGMITAQTMSTPLSPSTTDRIPNQVDCEVQQQQSLEERQSRHKKIKVSNDEYKNTTNHSLPDHDHHLNHHHTSSNFSQQQHIIDTMITRPIACV